MSAFHDIIASQLAGFLFHTAVMHCLCVSFSQLQGHGWGQLAGMGVCVCVFLNFFVCGQLAGMGVMFFPLGP